MLQSITFVLYNTFAHLPVHHSLYNARNTSCFKISFMKATVSQCGVDISYSIYTFEFKIGKLYVSKEVGRLNEHIGLTFLRKHKRIEISMKYSF